MNEFLHDLVDPVLTSGTDVLSTLADTFGEFISNHGILAAFGLLLVEESGVPLPVPGDVMVLYVGHQVVQGDLEWWAALMAFVLVVVAGSSILYAIARVGGPSFLHRFGRVLHFNDRSLARAESFFQRRGIFAIIFGRHIPGLRVPITLAAGVFKVPYPKFAAGVAISTTIWAGAFLALGAALGDRAVALLKPHRASYAVVGLGLVGILGAVIILRRRNRRLPERRSRPRPGPGPDPTPG